MKRLIIGVSLGALLVAGCSSLTNGNSVTPSQSPGNLTSNKAQLAIGTAKLADGTVGLNVVATFRQPNGRSATLVNTPSIAGPPGFIVPNTGSQGGNGNGGSGSDAGTSSITAQPQVFPTPSGQDTFGSTGGVFASGLAPLNNNTNSKNAYYPGNSSGPTQPSWGLPFYSMMTEPYIIGPPGVPFFNDGTAPSNFAGYMSGFTPFETAPVAGTYGLTIAVTTVNAGSPTFSASATLTNLGPLPGLPAPTFTEDGKGGGTASVTVPSDPRIVETLIYVVDTAAANKKGLYYTSPPLPGTGTLSFVLPPNLGPCAVFVSGCQTTNPGTSITTGDTYSVYAASFDYPQFEAEPPANVTQTPAIVGAGGQADVTLSPAFSGTY